LDDRGEDADGVAGLFDAEGVFAPRSKQARQADKPGRTVMVTP